LLLSEGHAGLALAGSAGMYWREAGEAQDPQFAACVKRGRPGEVLAQLLGRQGAEFVSLEYFVAAEEPSFRSLCTRDARNQFHFFYFAACPSHFSKGEESNYSPLKPI
jgi:hypothetical protein